MRVHSQANSSARNRWIRLLPMAALAAFYAIVSLRWWSTAAHHASHAWRGTLTADDVMIAAYGVSTAIFYVIMTVLMLTRKPPVQREKRLIAWLLPVSVVLIGMMGIQHPRSSSSTLTLVATVFIVGGTGFTFYALRHLGRHFGVVSDVRGLVTSGPYRLVRHPLYAAEAITAFGLLMSSYSALTSSVFIAALALQLCRAKVEEQALAAAFPEYHVYASRTPMILPAVLPNSAAWKRVGSQI
jgi:protein-S-isoprenylcysteine O-methyltransferase Ste14